MKDLINTESLTFRLYSKIAGDLQATTLEQRILRVVTLVSALAAVLICGINLISSENIPASIAAATVALFYFSFFFSIPRYKQIRMFAWLYLFTTYGILTLDWFYISGRDGIAFPLVIVLSGIIPIFFKGRSLKTAMTANFVVLITIYLISYKFIDNIISKELTKQLLSDIFLDTFVLSLCIMLLIVLVMRSHMIKNSQINHLNEELDQKNSELNLKISELQNAMGEIKTLQGIIPICSYCKNIRNDKGYYETLENYIARHSDADFSHTYCPKCIEKHFPHLHSKMKKDKKD